MRAIPSGRQQLSDPDHWLSSTYQQQDYPAFHSQQAGLGDKKPPGGDAPVSGSYPCRLADGLPADLVHPVCRSEMGSHPWKTAALPLS